MRGVRSRRSDAPRSPATKTSGSPSGARATNSPTVIVGLSPFWGVVVIGRKDEGGGRRAKGTPDSIPFALHPPALNLQTRSGLDEPVVAVLALVEHAQAVGVGVAEDDELVAVLGERHDGLLRRHRLHLVAARRDDAPRAALRFRVLRRGRPRLVRRDGRERDGVLLTLDDLFLELEGLLLDLVDAPRERLIHVGVGVFGRERVLAPVEQNLRDVPVLDDVYDDVGARRGGVLEQLTDLAEVLLDVRAQRGRDVDVSPRVFEIHT